MYSNKKITFASPGKGILDTFHITSDTGKTIMVASDSGCTTQLILKEAISKGLIQHVQSGTTAMIQVARGSTIPGENFNCLLPLRKKGKSEYMETIATTVPTILKDIPIVDIKELARDVYQEYTNECRHKGTTPSCKLEDLPTFYGGKLTMLLSSQTYRPRVFFTSKEGTMLAHHPF